MKLDKAVDSRTEAISHLGVDVHASRSLPSRVLDQFHVIEVYSERALVGILECEDIRRFIKMSKKMQKMQTDLH